MLFLFSCHSQCAQWHLSFPCLNEVLHSLEQANAVYDRVIFFEPIASSSVLQIISQLAKRSKILVLREELLYF